MDGDQILFWMGGVRIEDELPGDIYPHLCIGVNKQADREQLPVFFADRRYDRALLNKRFVREYAGIIGIIPRDDAALARIWNSMERRIPCVNVMIESRREASNYVGTDDEAAAYLLTDHCLREGHTSVGFIATDSGSYTMHRYAGYLRALREHGRPVTQNTVFGIDVATGAANADLYWRTTGLSWAQWLTAMLERATQFYTAGERSADALIVPGHGFANSLAARFMQRGVSVPEDIAVATFDAVLQGRDVLPLTTILQDYTALGVRAVALLASIMRGKHPRFGNRVSLTPRLVVRRSTLKRSRKVRRRDDFRERVLAYIRGHYNDPKAIRLIHEQFGFTPSYFSERFTAVFGIPCRRFVNDERTAAAATLLADGTTPITDIVRQVGFNNYQNFNTFFRRRFGISPREYRALHGRP